jgi:hypothetical protein
MIYYAVLVRNSNAIVIVATAIRLLLNYIIIMINERPRSLIVDVCLVAMYVHSNSTINSISIANNL